MGSEQAPGHFPRISRYAATFTLTVTGCVLLFAVLRIHTGRSALPASASGQVVRAASARGGLRQRPQPTGYVLAMAVGPATSTPVVRVLSPLSATVEARSVSATPLVIESEERLALGGPLAPSTPIRAAEALTATPAVATGEAALALELLQTPTMETPVAPTPTPTPKAEVIVYKVEPGDNLWLIAQRFHLSQDTVVWANPELERDPDQLSVGQELYILPVDGVWHTVKAGETLAGIAKRYQVEAQQIAAYAPNGISDARVLQVGQKLIIPGGIKPPEPRPTAAPAQAKAAPAQNPPGNGQRLFIPAGAPDPPVEAPAQPGRFIWPVQGLLTQGYGKWHGAIDIANKQGTPIVAADGGSVSFAAVSGGLGNTIQIDHGDGFATTYAHLHTIGVQVGQKVNKGDQIATMGTTGHSTGPHLHLIITYKGGIVDPMLYLGK